MLEPRNRPRIANGTISPISELCAGPPSPPAKACSARSATNSVTAASPCTTNGTSAISTRHSRATPPGPSSTHFLRWPLRATSQAPTSGATRPAALLIEARRPSVADDAPMAIMYSTTNSAKKALLAEEKNPSSHRRLIPRRWSGAAWSASWILVTRCSRIARRSRTSGRFTMLAFW